MSILNFFKIKKTSLDVFLNKKISVEEKLNYALSELDKKSFTYKESLIDLVAHRDTLKETIKTMEKNVKNAHDEAKNLKDKGQETLAKSKIAVMLSYEQVLDDLNKTYKDVSLKVEENKNILIQIEANKEVLAAQASVIKTKSSIVGANTVTINFEDITNLIRGIEIDVNAREEVEETLSPKSNTDAGINSDKIEKVFKSL